MPFPARQNARKSFRMDSGCFQCLQRCHYQMVSGCGLAGICSSVNGGGGRLKEGSETSFFIETACEDFQAIRFLLLRISIYWSTEMLHFLNSLHSLWDIFMSFGMWPCPSSPEPLRMPNWITMTPLCQNLTKICRLALLSTSAPSFFWIAQPSDAISFKPF